MYWEESLDHPSIVREMIGSRTDQRAVGARCVKSFQINKGRISHRNVLRAPTRLLGFGRMHEGEPCKRFRCKRHWNPLVILTYYRIKCTYKQGADSYPTERTKMIARRFRKKKGKGKARRGRVEAPKIFVAVGRNEDGPKYSQAHLRNRGGYLYLSWRDGDRVREFYLGKGRKVSPTKGPAAVRALCGR